MVYGDRQPHLVALMVPDPDFIKDWAARNNAADDLAALVENPAFTRAVGAAVERVNSHARAARARPPLRRAAGALHHRQRAC